MHEEINRRLIEAGLDGNGRFRSAGHALTAAYDVLSKFGIEPAEVEPQWLLSRLPLGRFVASLAWSNPEDPFSPVPLKHHALGFSWYQHGPDRYEALAYVS